ncbi:MAG: hypothetical protein AAB288_10155, partial [Acidobacteriota bacterium]
VAVMLMKDIREPTQTADLDLLVLEANMARPARIRKHQPLTYRGQNRGDRQDGTIDHRNYRQMGNCAGLPEIIANCPFPILGLDELLLQVGDPTKVRHGSSILEGSCAE